MTTDIDTLRELNDAYLESVRMGDVERFREILADDFESLVSLDALGTSVPAGHHAVAIEHVDRIIENGIDEEAMAPLVTDQHLR